MGQNFVYNNYYVFARTLFTNDQTKLTRASFGASRSTAFIVDFIWEVNCTQLSNNNHQIP